MTPPFLPPELKCNSNAAGGGGQESHYGKARAWGPLKFYTPTQDSLCL